MKEIYGDLWDFYGNPDTFVCITTNGTVKKDGCLVMGRGCAAQLKHRMPGIDRVFGRRVRYHGGPWTEVIHGFPLVMFGVKWDWRNPVDIALIYRSAAQLRDIAQVFSQSTFILPRPECGNGGLKWEDVREVIKDVLPDNVHVITKLKENK